MLYENVTIDLETLDIQTSAKILSIGVVPWNQGENTTFQELLERESSLYLKIDMNSYLSPSLSFTESTSTVEWWDKQGEAAQHVLQEEDSDVPIRVALSYLKQHLDKYVKPLSKDAGLIFCRGYDFDGGILEHAFSQCGLPLPWQYNRFRCVRTVIDTLALTRNGYVYEKNPDGFIKHHALHDAAKDTLTMLNLHAKKGEVQ